MRILVLTNLYPPHYLGGYELICEAVTNALRSRGHQVSVLTSNHICQDDAVPAEQGIERGLRIHGLYGHAWLSISSLWRLEAHNNQMLRRAVQRFKPDLVYVWNMGGLSRSMLFTLEKLKLPVAFYVSDHWMARAAEADVWLRWWNRVDGSIQHKLLRGIASVIGFRSCISHIAPTQPFSCYYFRRIYFCSRALRKLTASAGLDVMHGSVIYCPVDISRFSGIPKPKSEPLRRLLWVGRLAPDKGIMTALKAIKRINGKFSGTLSVYGSGDQEYVLELKRFATVNRLPVEFQSASASEMPAVYRAHDGLLFTSEWAEPFALTPLEAMASGLPVIATMTGGSRELFRNGYNSLTYTAGNAEELAERILRLTSDSVLRLRIGTVGQSEVRSNYSEPVIVNQIEEFLMRAIAGWRNPDVGSVVEETGTSLINTSLQWGANEQVSELNRFSCTEEIVETVNAGSISISSPLMRGFNDTSKLSSSVEPRRSIVDRFTLDGSDSLESSLRDLTATAVVGVRSCVPASRLEGLVLGGGYGRGEGGVLKTKAGDQPYNDLEFYVFIRGPVWLNEQRYGASFHQLAGRLSKIIGIDVEFKILSLQKLRSSPVSMFYYDLVSGHKILFGHEHLLDGCEHHRVPHRIPLYECTRLLMNRCAGLLYALDRLQRLPFSAGEGNFVARNIAKAQLCFGDVLLAASGQYHWSCRERHRRLPKLLDEFEEPWAEQILQEHADGFAFKLHPQLSNEPSAHLLERHARVSELGRRVWLWLENRRLKKDFATSVAYSFNTQNKCPEVSKLRARAVSARAFGWQSLIEPESSRYPRERLLNTLPVLLWQLEMHGERSIIQFIQKQLRTCVNDFHQWVLAYQNIWNRFN